MKKFKTHFFVLLLSHICLPLFSQLELSTHFMDHLWQSNLTNPAQFSNRGISVSLPSAYIGFHSPNLKYGDVFKSGKNNWEVDMDNIVNQLNSKNFKFQTNLTIETFAIAIQGKNWLVNAHHGVKVHQFAKVPKDAINFFWGGKEQFLGEEINLSVDENFQAYHEWGVGVGYQILPSTTIGFRLKYLNGIATYWNTNASAKATIDEQTGEITATTDFLFKTGGVPGGNIQNAAFIETDDLMSNFFSKNNGFALDFGITHRPNQKLKLAVSLNNLGYISWKQQAHTYHSFGKKEINELDFKPLYENGNLTFREVVDTLATTFRAKHFEAPFSVTTPLSGYASGQYEIQENLFVGGLFFFQKHESHYRNGIGLNVKKHFGKRATLGTQYSFWNGGNHSIGLMTSLHLGPVQVFAITDNALLIGGVRNLKNTNLRIGMNLVFKNKDKIKKKESQLDMLLGSNQQNENQNLESQEIKKEPLLTTNSNTEKNKVQTPSTKTPTLSTKGNEVTLEKSKTEEQAKALQKIEAEKLRLQEEALAKKQVEIEKEKAEELARQEQLRKAEELARQEQLKKAKELAKQEQLRKEKEKVAELQEQFKKQAAERAKQKRLDKELAEAARQKQLAIAAAEAEQKKKITPSNFGTYKLSKKTSLRADATSSSKVLKRLETSSNVIVLEKTSKYWWKVNYNGKIGYVKALLLKK